MGRCCKNRDIAEVYGSDPPPILPSSFLYKKELGYEAVVDRNDSQLFSLSSSVEPTLTSLACGSWAQ